MGGRNSMRETAKRFFTLSLSQRNHILGKLDLIDEADSNTPDFERHRRALSKAIERDQVDQLNDEIKSKEKNNG